MNPNENLYIITSLSLDISFYFHHFDSLVQTLKLIVSEGVNCQKPPKKWEESPVEKAKISVLSAMPRNSRVGHLSRKREKQTE